METLLLLVTPVGLVLLVVVFGCATAFTLTEAEWERLPLLPLTVTSNTPDAIEVVLRVIVTSSGYATPHSQVDGCNGFLLKETLTSGDIGETVAVRETGPLNPSVGYAVMLNSVSFPGVTLAEIGEAYMMKSPAAETGIFGVSKRSPTAMRRILADQMLAFRPSKGNT